MSKKPVLKYLCFWGVGNLSLEDQWTGNMGFHDLRNFRFRIVRLKYSIYSTSPVHIFTI